MESKKAEARSDGFPRGISAPATRALHAAGFTTLEQLTTVSAAELLALHGFGPKALRILQAALAEKGLSLRPDVEQ
jgi:DNA-directed RNA polymerase alpha subunit